MYHSNISRSNAKLKGPVSVQIHGEPDMTVVTCFFDTTSAFSRIECGMPYKR